MNRFSSCIRLAVVALGLLANAAPTYSGERPIKGSGSGLLNLNHAQLNGGGKVRHLGRSGLTVILDPNALFDSGDVRPQICVFTAANGDFLAASVIDGFFDPEVGILAATLSFRPVVDGRFADASGTANLLIVFEDWTDIFGNPSFDFSVEGTIDY